MSALSDLQNSLDQIRAIANDITSQAAAALADSAVRARHTTIQCSCVVLLTGFFESFIRQFAEEAVQSLCALNTPFGSLDAKVKKTHFEEGGRVLQQKASGKPRFAWIVASPEDISRRLHSVAAPSGYEIVWEAFAETGANPGVEVVREFLGKFGIKDGWGLIATTNGVSKAWAKQSLENIIVVRNECAHTGAVAIVPLPSDLIDHCNNLQKIATAMNTIVLSHICSLAPVMASAAPPPTLSTPGSSPSTSPVVISSTPPAGQVPNPV